MQNNCMGRCVRYIFTVLAVAALASCEPTVIPDANVRYGYMFDCIWTPDAYSGSQTAIPALFMNPDRHLYFTSHGRMAVLEKRGDIYRYLEEYSCMIDTGADKMTLRQTDENHYFVVDRICETHMTLLYDGKDTEYISYRRTELTEETHEDGRLDKTSFPEGWF